MDVNDDVDEDELALAMSTELTQPVRSIPIRRARSFTSLGADAAAGNQTIFIQGSQQRTSPASKPQDAHSALFPAKLIRLQDKSTELPDKDDSDGLWASSVTVTDPSIVRGTERQGISAATGYVGPSLHP